MATKYWIKLYHELLDDRKAAQLPANLWRRFIECCLLAGEMGYEDYDPQKGRLPPIGDIAWRLHIDESTLTEELESLARRGLLEYRADNVLSGYWFVTSFAERQLPMKKKEYMARKRKAENSPPPLGSSYQGVTNGNADIDIDKNRLDKDIDKTAAPLYIHPDPQPVVEIKTALSETTKTAQLFNEEDYDKAAYTLLGFDATPDAVRGFGEWWGENGYYPGKPALKSLVSEWRNYQAGVKVKAKNETARAVPNFDNRVGGAY